MAKVQPAALQAIKPIRLYEQIANQIGGLIRESQYVAGDRLPPERELAQRLGVSRPAVREAMIALETVGLIEVRSGDGTYVREVPIGGIWFPWAQNGDPGPGPLEQFESRCLVEPFLARKAAECATPDEIAELERLLVEMEADYEKGVQQNPAGYRLHVAVAQISGNGILTKLVADLLGMRRAEMWRRLMSRVVRREDIRLGLVDRRALVEAITRHDVDGAGRAMSNLLERTRNLYFD